jgi:hypothetical protein
MTQEGALMTIFANCPLLLKGVDSDQVVSFFALPLIAHSLAL